MRAVYDKNDIISHKKDSKVMFSVVLHCAVNVLQCTDVCTRDNRAQFHIGPVGGTGQEGQ